MSPMKAYNVRPHQIMSDGVITQSVVSAGGDKFIIISDSDDGCRVWPRHDDLMSPGQKVGEESMWHHAPAFEDVAFHEQCLLAKKRAAEHRS